MTKTIYRHFSKSRLLISGMATLLIFSQLSLAKNLATHPFWQRSSGYWLSLNTYLDNQFEYKIKHYHSISHISVDGPKVTIQEFKFYPPGAFNGKYIGLSIPDDMGVELSLISSGQATSDINILDFSSEQQVNTLTQLNTFTDDSGLMTYTNTVSKEDSYRMLITMPSADTRVVVNLGLNNPKQSITDGPLRGVSIFSATRIVDSELEQKTQQLREQYQVGMLVSLNDAGKYQAIPVKP